MSDRATCWSITINNPIEADYKVELPAGWKLEGQLERGEVEGTLHYQGMLSTPQVRFSAVKKIFLKAHIEVARNRKALEKYVNKVETRVEKVETNFSRIPTLFEYQDIIAAKWSKDDFGQFCQKLMEKNQLSDFDEAAMCYLDQLVAADIESGRRGAEYIAVNPMWRSSWKKFWRSIIKRHARSSDSSSCTPAPFSASSDWSHAEAATQGSGQQSP